MLSLSRASIPDFRDAGGVPELKRHLRVMGDYADLEIGDIGNQSVAFIEELARITVFQSTFTYQLDCLESYFSLPRGPLVSVTSVQYQDSADTQQTWAGTEYDVDLAAGTIRLAYDKEVPQTITPAGVIVTYVAGYGATWEALPPLVKHVVKLVAHEMYYTRDSSPSLDKVINAVNQLNAGDEFGQI